MILDIPFRYEISGRKHGNVRYGDYQVWETMPIEIREVSPREAPLAVSWDDRFPEGMLLDAYARAEWGPHSLAGDAHTVFFDDSHWVALNADVSIVGPADTGYGPCLTDDIAAQIVHEKDCDLFQVREFDTRARRQVVEHGNDGHSMFSHVKYSHRRQTIGLRQKIAHDLISVDGRLYRKCDEPKLWLMVGTTHHDRTSSGERYRTAVMRVESKVSRTRKERTITPGGRLYFSVGEAHELHAFAAQYNEGRSQLSVAMTARNHHALPVVHQDHSIDEEAHATQRIEAAANDFLALAKDYKIGSIPRATAYLLLDLEGHLNVISEPDGLAAFEETVSRLRQDMLAPQHPLNRGLRYLDEMSTLLDSRNIDIAIAPAALRKPA